MYTYFLYVSLCFGNSLSFSWDKLQWLPWWCICEVEVSQILTTSLIPYLLLYVWNIVIVDLGKICLFHTKTNPKEIDADISIFLGYSVLYWHIVKQSSIFVRDPIFNLRFFVRVFSKALIVDYVVFPMQLMQTMFN